MILSCPVCGTQLRQGAKFCDNCGQRIVLAAEPPPAPVRPEGSVPAFVAAVTSRSSPTLEVLQRFIPPEFAAKVEAARHSQALEGERRVVTMLFCDVKGSTSAAEQLDPEEWSEIMNGAFAYMIRPVYAYEGSVVRLMGDAVLAFFGAPIAHEDDPERAVLAGLDIAAKIQPYCRQLKDQYGLDFAVRVGINTGLVVVGAVGSDLRMEYTALGDAINLAARMEQTAAPNTVQVAHDTYRRVAELFEFEALGEREVKGKAEPVRAYRALRRKATRAQLRGIAGLAAPLVGRGQELAAVELAWSAVRGGAGQVVCLIGEAGLGKSRLIAELRGRVEAETGAAWHEANSLSYESAVPYGLFKSLMRQACGAAPNDTGEALRAKVAAFAATLPAELPGGRDQARRVLLALFGLSPDPSGTALEGETFKNLLFGVVPEVWHELAHRAPIVLVFDDLHWSDPASVALLCQGLLPLVAHVPLLLLCALRPDREAPGWQVTADAAQLAGRYTEVQVRRLTDTDSSALVDNLLTIADLPEKLRRLILNKAEGNPFFVEELVRTLIEQGVVVRTPDGLHWRSRSGAAGDDAGDKLADEIAGVLPDSLQALLIARIDRLEEAARLTLQLAALIGRTFYYRVLQAIAEAELELDHQLETLEQADLIREAARRPELEYVFRHVLTQEAAYKTILHRRRRTYHRRVGEALEALYPERLAENASALAHHFDEAGEAERALKYYTLAGDQAFRLYANAEAFDHYSRALAIALGLPAPGKGLAHLYSRRGRSLELQAQFADALANYQQMEQQAIERSDPRLRLESLLPQGRVRSITGQAIDQAESERLAQEALALAEALGDREAQARVFWNLCNLYRSLGRMDVLEQSRDYGERALRLARELNLSELLPYVLNDLSHANVFLGNYDRALAVLREAAALWREQGNLPMLADTLSNQAGLLNDLDEALALSEEAYQISRAIGNLWGQAHSSQLVGFQHVMRGDVGQGLAALETAIEASHKTGIVVSEFMARGYLAGLYANLGALERGLAKVQQALALTGQVPPEWHNFIHQCRAEMYFAAGDIDAAEAIIHEQGLTSESMDMAVWVPTPAMIFAQIAVARGRAGEALQLLDRRRAFLESRKVRPLIAEALYWRGRALRGLGDVDAARESLAAARSEAEAMGLRWVLWESLAALADLEATYGDAGQAAALREQARGVIGYIAERTPAELRAGFLERENVRRVMDHGPQGGTDRA